MSHLHAHLAKTEGKDGREGVNALRSPTFSALVITHHQRLLDHLVPHRVHVLAGGRIVRSGGAELAKELELHGYGAMLAEAA